MNRPQTIIVPDDRGCLMTVPLTSPEVIRVVLRVGIKNLDHRKKVERFLMQKYYPEEIMRDTQNLVMMVEEKLKKIDDVVDEIKSIIQDNIFESVRDEEEQEETEELVDTLREEGVKELIDANLQQKIKHVVIIAEQEKGGELYESASMIIEELQEIKKKGQEIQEKAESMERRVREEMMVEEEKISENMRMVRETHIVFNEENREMRTTQKTSSVCMNVINGDDLKSNMSYHFNGLQIDIEGRIYEGEVQIYTNKKKQLQAPWELYCERHFPGTDVERVRVKITNDQVVPDMVDIEKPIRQMQVRFSLFGAINSQVKIRIKAKFTTMRWTTFRHDEMLRRSRLIDPPPSKIKRKKKN